MTTIVTIVMKVVPNSPKKDKNKKNPKKKKKSSTLEVNFSYISDKFSDTLPSELDNHYPYHVHREC